MHRTMLSKPRQTTTLRIHILNGRGLEIRRHFPHPRNALNDAQDFLFQLGLGQNSGCMDLSTLYANINSQITRFRRDDKGGLHAGKDCKILKVPLRVGSGLVVCSSCRLHDQVSGSLQTHLGDIEHHVVTARIPPVGAEYCLQPPMPRLINLFDVL